MGLSESVDDNVEYDSLDEMVNGQSEGKKREKVSYVDSNAFREVAENMARIEEPFTIEYVNSGRVLYPDREDMSVVVEVNELDHLDIDGSLINEDYAGKVRAVHNAMDRIQPTQAKGSRPTYSKPKRWIRRFVSGHTRSGRMVGGLLDIGESFLPSWIGDLRTEIKKWDKLRTTMEDGIVKKKKPWIKQKSTFEAIAAIAGAFGIILNPQAIAEIVAGVLLVVGGIEAWKTEDEDGKES